MSTVLSNNHGYVVHAFFLLPNYCSLLSPTYPYCFSIQEEGKTSHSNLQLIAVTQQPVQCTNNFAWCQQILVLHLIMSISMLQAIQWWELPHIVQLDPWNSSPMNRFVFTSYMSKGHLSLRITGIKTIFANESCLVTLEVSCSNEVLFISWREWSHVFCIPIITSTKDMV